MSAVEPAVTPEDYQRHRARARHRPAWWLRFREHRAGPAERAAIRRELLTRSALRWWVA